MKVIGVTGTSGAGKTTICKILEEKYNAYIIDADEVAKKLSQKGNMYLEDIVKYFGTTIVDSNGDLKRKELANIIYEDNEKRDYLNQLTFTYVVEEIKEMINSFKNERLVAIDAPLLFESGLDKKCDLVIGVIADEKQKIERICKRDKITKEVAKKRLSIQISENELKKRASYIIENKDDLKILERDIKKIEVKFK